MSNARRALGWFVAFVAATACSLNPQIDPPSGLQENKGTGGVPISNPASGGSGNAQGNGGFSQGAGGNPPGAGGSPGGGAAGATGSGGASSADASAPPDGAVPSDGGPHDGGRGGDAGDARLDGAGTKDARKD